MTHAPTLTEGQALASPLLHHHPLPFKKNRRPFPTRSGLPLMLLAALLSTGAHAQQTDAQGNTSIGIDALSGQGGPSDSTEANTAIGYRTLWETFGSFNTSAGSGSLEGVRLPTPSTATRSSNNTAAGFEALLNSINGVNNVALGSQALRENTDGSGSVAIGFSALKTSSQLDNIVAIGTSALESQFPGTGSTDRHGQTGIGASALRYNTGRNLTATGYQALQGDSANFNAAVVNGAGQTMTDNTANGYAAMRSQISSSQNVAVGAYAFSRSAGAGYSVAVGAESLQAFNGTGNSGFNVGVGFQTLFQGNSFSVNNTALGHKALFNNGGSDNSAMGASALPKLTSGNRNTAMGFQSLFNLTSGSDNTAIGYRAGINLPTGNHNIYIGSAGGTAGVAESNTIRIGTHVNATQTVPSTRMFLAGIVGNVISSQQSLPVYVNLNTGRLGVFPSSARFKRDIEDMGSVSDAIYSLRPVTYQYKAEFDPAGTPQIGLIAEEVETVNPDLVVHGADNQIETVRYEAVDALLLNEIQKQQKMILERQKELDALKAQFAAIAEASAN
jgi:trimeric autotransporter adhesin